MDHVESWSQADFLKELENVPSVIVGKFKTQFCFQ